MNNQLVPEELLQKSKKILFVTHLAIGDFTYLQNYFKAFAEKYPHLKVDVWVDEVRRTRCFWRWNKLKGYSLYDWLNASPCFNKVYDKTYSPATFKQSLHEAQTEEYPIVVSIATLRPYRYAQLIRSISPKAFVVGMQKGTKPYQWYQRNEYKKLDASFNPDKVSGGHITDHYAAWFNKLFNLDVDNEQRRPFVAIPSEWNSYAKLQFLKHGFYQKDNKTHGKVFFINCFAKSKKRCWPVNKAIGLIEKMRSEGHSDARFIINAIPSEYQRIKGILKDSRLKNVILFSARENFFQLPAIMSCCDMVISVETATIHLASALEVPVVALMRQKNPEWAPWDTKKSSLVTAKKRSDWVSNIPVQQVIAALPGLM